MRELGGGKSSLAFSYRIVAKRRDVHAPRLPELKMPKVAVWRFARAASAGSIVILATIVSLT